MTDPGATIEGTRFPKDGRAAAEGSAAGGSAFGHARTRRSTQKRRSLQPLWSALDAALLDAALLDPALPDGALLAVSGGPDSRALLEAAARWPRRFDRPIEVAAVDHGTRPESHAEADAVAARARALGFTAAVLTVDDDGGGNEARWRAVRYAALFEHARRRGLSAVVVAHHEGDAAENALLGLLGEGGGPIRPVVGVEGVVVVRPFLALSRATLREALSACGVADDAFTDPDATSSRARLRRRVLAPLSAMRSDVEGRLARHNAVAGDDDDALTAAAATLVRDVEQGVHVAASERPALIARALKLGLERAWATLAGPPPDPRDAAAAVASAAALIRAKRAGHVDAPRAAIDVDEKGEALIVGRVADGPAATHDGRVRRLSVLRPVPIMGTMRKDPRDFE